MDHVTKDRHGHCPHCNTFITAITKHGWNVVVYQELGQPFVDTLRSSSIRIAQCPRCNEYIIDWVEILSEPEDDGDVRVVAWKRLHPVYVVREAPSEVPEHVRVDYAEASKVEQLSTAAAAALARRCLQSALRDKGFRDHTLEREIKLVEGTPNLPTTLIQKLQIVRNVGNYAAHPTEDGQGDFLRVEPGEVEALFGALDEFFDHF